MAEASVAGQIREVLSKVHAATRLGQMTAALGDSPVVVPPGMPGDEIIRYLLREVEALEAIVVRLANEVDRLKAAEAVG